MQYMLSTSNQKNHSLGGQSFKLKKERSMKNIRQQYNSNRILNSWNVLPTEVVCAPSLNAFKTDSYWRQYRYSQHSVPGAYNFKKSHLERPRPDTGYVA